MRYLSHLVECSVRQVELPYYDCPNISEGMYSLAISLIQSFDEMEAKESR